MFQVSLHIFYSWAQALVFHLRILDWLPLLHSSTCCITQDVATHCIYYLLCHMAFTSSCLQEYWLLATQCFVLFLIHSLLPLSYRSWSSLLFSLLANVRVFNISHPLFRWSYASICWCNWYLELCLGMRFLCFFGGGFTSCIRSFQVCTCGASSLNLVMPCVAHLSVIVWLFAWCAYLMQRSQPCVFMQSEFIADLWYLFLYSLWSTNFFCSAYIRKPSKYIFMS